MITAGALLFASAAVVSPGADFAMVTKNSLSLSRRAGILTALGIALGVLGHVFYAVVGVGLLISRYPLLADLIQTAGALYIAYLGVKGFLSAGGKLSAVEVQGGARPFRMGFFTNILNPKTSLFVLTLYSQIITGSTNLVEMVALGLIISLMHLFWFSFVALLLSSRAVSGRIQEKKKLIDRGLSCLLILLGIKLFLSTSLFS